MKTNPTKRKKTTQNNKLETQIQTQTNLVSWKQQERNNSKQQPWDSKHLNPKSIMKTQTNLVRTKKKGRISRKNKSKLRLKKASRKINLTRNRQAKIQKGAEFWQCGGREGASPSLRDTLWCTASPHSPPLYQTTNIPTACCSDFSQWNLLSCTHNSHPRWISLLWGQKLRVGR